MIKIPQLNEETRKLFSFSPLQYMFDCVAIKPQLAEIYVDEEKSPACCALLLGHYLFLSRVDEGFMEKLYTAVFQDDKRKALGVMIVFYDNDISANLIKNKFNKVYENSRSLYRFHDNQIFSDIKDDKIIPITEELLNSDIENIEMITQEVLGTATYDGMKDFCQNGIGYTFVDQNRICAFCTSEYPGESAFAIGIEVDAKYQQQGIASNMTKALLNKAISRKSIVFWECWKDNKASVKTALKCGFQKVEDYPVLFVDMNDQ